MENLSEKEKKTLIQSIRSFKLPTAFVTFLNHILGVVSDGASVMKRFVRLLEVEQHGEDEEE